MKEAEGRLGQREKTGGMWLGTTSVKPLGSSGSLQPLWVIGWVAFRHCPAMGEAAVFSWHCRDPWLEDLADHTIFNWSAGPSLKGHLGGTTLSAIGYYLFDA